MIIGNPEDIQIQNKLNYIMRKLRNGLGAIVAELAEHTSEDELDVKGLGGVLQTELEMAETGNPDNKRENINDHLGNIEVMERPIHTPSKGFFYGKGR